MTRSIQLCAAAAVVLLAAPGCGKKGSPLPPLIHVPAAPGRIEARRIGNDVYVEVPVPATNVDASVPADVERIEIYAYTGRVAPPRARWVQFAAQVANIPVAPIDSAHPEALGDPTLGVLQGTSVSIRDTLTAAETVEGKVDISPPPRRGVAAPPPPVDTSNLPLKRFYFVLAFGPRDRPGPVTTTELPLDVLPDAPGDVEASVTAADVSVSWEPSGGLVGFLFENTLLPETSPAEDFAVVPPPPTARAPAAPSGPTRYNVYRDPPPVLPAGARSVPASKWTAEPEVPLNDTPLAITTFSDDVAFGQRRCYTVRAVRGAAPNVIESEPSPPACVTPVDRFPPAAPAALAAVAAGGAISLIWEPNAEPDLAGYIVLRGAVGDATLQRLSTALVTEARYRDMDVVSGTRYVYAVVAVDAAKPTPNISRESLRVEETAR